MKLQKIIFSVVVGCFFTLSLCMEEKRSNVDLRTSESNYSQDYDRLVDELLSIEDNLENSINKLAPKTIKELIEFIKDKSIKINSSYNPQKLNLQERYEVGSLLQKLGGLVDNLNDALDQPTRILERLVNTDRSLVPSKIQTFSPELKENLINVCEKELIPGAKNSKDPRAPRTLNKLEFIVNLLKK